MAKRRTPGRFVAFCAIDEFDLFHLEDFISLDKKGRCIGSARRYVATRDGVSVAT
jgi:hypothetical protein